MRNCNGSMDTNQHKFLMMQILKDIYSDATLASMLGFKGGTALMFFYQLPRFSVDLDFNLLDLDKQEEVFMRVRRILLKYGKIHDEAIKFYGPLLVLDYGVGERKLKVEISNRQYDNHYEWRNLLGIQIRVMTEADMFAHKLCALLDRTETTNRDIFDCWFFLNRRTPINRQIVESRMETSLEEYLPRCIDSLQQMPARSLLNGLGELTDSSTKAFVRNKLLPETIQLLQLFQALPLTV